MLHAKAWIAAATLTLAIAVPASAGERPALREEAAVVGAVVRIGDLIEHAGAFADIAIFRAPDPGHTGTVEASRVLDAARRHGLDAVDARGLMEVAVTRLSRSLGTKEIEDRVAAALARRSGLGDGASFALTFDRDVGALELDPNAGELIATRVAYSPSSSRFDVIMEAAASAGGQRLRLRYTGTAVATVEVAVLLRPLGRGDIIRASDVAIERRPKATVAGGSLDRLEAALGLAARRTLPAGQPLRGADLMKPELVRQNELVTVVYAAPGLSLTMRGKAMESGAEGDLVNVANIQTKRTMQGMVTGPGQVTIMTIAAQVIGGDRNSTTGSIAANPSRERTE